MSDLHTHKCGFDPGKPERTGCGHVWEHDGESHPDHACPKCGAGPWRWRLEERSDDGVGRRLRRILQELGYV